MLFRVRSCKPVKRPERLDEKSLFFWCVGRAHCTEERCDVPVSREFLISEVYFKFLCRVEDSERKAGVRVEGQ